ncbi:MAG TPA: NAD-dependent deacylase [Blastocatellia bacterium]|jgi:NAD-dependent deacetylase|nr:NAD-dependent deacylase [Blastocatellia bacterium]
MVLTEVTDELISMFDSAASVAVLTGAGVSAESGVPTFRGGGGAEIWSWRGRPVTELSSAELMATDPQLVWEWFDYRRGMLKEVAPNAGHLALAKWERRFPEFTLITQNIDDLHRAAGSMNLLELHGNIWRARCLRCSSTFEVRESPLEQNPPRCLVCGQAARPDVVLFGEMLPEGVLERAEHAASRADLFFVIGTSAVVYPAASLPIVAKNSGAKVIEVNPERTDITMFANVTLLGKAAEVLPQFLREAG